MLRLRLNKNGSNSPSNRITSASQDDSYRPSSLSNLKTPRAADCNGKCALKLKISPPTNRSIGLYRSITSSSYGSNDHEQHHHLSPLKISSSHESPPRLLYVNQSLHDKISPKSVLFIFMALASFTVGVFINWKDPYEGRPRCATFETMPQHSSPHVNRHFRALWSSNFQHNLSPFTQDEEELAEMDKTGQSINDSNDEQGGDVSQQNKGVQKVTGNSEDCVPKAPWQTTSYPTCNNIHEIDFRHSVGRDILSHIFAEQQTGRRFVTNYSSSKSLQQKQEVDLELKGQGWFRTAWLMDRKTSPFKAEYRRDEQLVLKTLRIERDFAEEFYELHRRDAMAMERLTQSPYVMHIYGYCGQSALNEFANGGTLDTMFNSGAHNKKDKLKLAYEVAKGVSDVHSIDYADFTPPRDGSGVSLTSSNATMVHYDLNQQNIVVVDGFPKLNDFNLAMFLSWDPKEKATCGFEGRFTEPFWRSPEEMQNHLEDGTDDVALTEKVDVYSLGNILWKILTNASPWREEKQKAIRFGSIEAMDEAVMDELRPRVARGDMPKLPSKIADSTEPTIVAIKNAMYKCLRVNPEERASAGEVAHDLKIALEEVKRLEKEENELKKKAELAGGDIRFTTKTLKDINAPTKPVEKIILLGERHSGTNWITDHLIECFQDDHVKVTDKYKRFKHWFQEEDLQRVPENSAVVVAMFRDPYMWVEAMRVKPHHAHNHIIMPQSVEPNLEGWRRRGRPMGWKEFVTKPWIGNTKRGPRDINITNTPGGKESVVCHNKYSFVDVSPCSPDDTKALIEGLGDNFYELQHDGSERAYSSVIDLRRDKIINHLSVADFLGTRAFLPSRYEDLNANGTSILLRSIEEATGLKANCSVTFGKGRTKHAELSDEFVEWMNKFVDWEVESRIGYYKRD